MLKPKKGVCEECAVGHKPEEPHDASSLAYQYSFYDKHGRWPNWKDAMGHCSDELKKAWKAGLEKAGIDVEAGRVYPPKEKLDELANNNTPKK